MLDRYGEDRNRHARNSAPIAVFAHTALILFSRARLFSIRLQLSLLEPAIVSDDKCEHLSETFPFLSFFAKGTTPRWRGYHNWYWPVSPCQPLQNASSRRVNTLFSGAYGPHFFDKPRLPAIIIVPPKAASTFTIGIAQRQQRRWLHPS